MAGEKFMVAATAKGRQLEVGLTGEALMSFSNLVFDFLDGGEESLSSPPNPGDGDEETEDDGENSGKVEERHKYWATQNQLLERTLCRTSSIESKIRIATKEAVNDVKNRDNRCCCRVSVDVDCRNCFMKQVSEHLCNAGHNCAIRKNKWRHSNDVPSGEHTFLEVIHNSASKKGKTLRIIIELNFRTEFEIAKASEDYNQLVKRLPKIFVGKVERLDTVISIMCLAAKKCMKEKKMHIGPWRKQRYMQAKWFGSCESSSPLLVEFSERFLKPKASLLTVDLSEMKPNLHFAAVKVV